MRIAFLYGAQFLGGRPIDFTNVWDSPRGLTGSEISWLMFAKEMHRRGHDVGLHVWDPADTKEWESIPLNRVRQLADVVYAWISPDLLTAVPKDALRVVNQQLNDWNYCHPGWDRYVDVITSPSRSHMEHMRSRTPAGMDKWEIVPNGCDPAQYSGAKVPGRVVYASCASRGLHLLLERWPEVKERVPEAHLRIFYNVQGWIDTVLECRPDEHQVARAHYIRDVLPKLRAYGVELVGSTSRRRMAREFSEAMVLAYPCDPVVFTEGFSVTTMEACASGTVPVISSADSLGQIYEGLPMVPAPPSKHMGDFVDHVVRGLTNPAWRAAVTSTARELASRHAWPVLAELLESILAKRLAERG